MRMRVCIKVMTGAAGVAEPDGIDSDVATPR